MNTEDICEDVDSSDLRREACKRGVWTLKSIGTYIEDDETDSDPEIPPVVRVANVEAVVEESIGGTVLTVQAAGGSVGIGNVPSVVVDVSLQVGLT